MKITISNIIVGIILFMIGISIGMVVISPDFSSKDVYIAWSEKYNRNTSVFDKKCLYLWYPTSDITSEGTRLLCVDLSVDNKEDE